ncbi:PACE efflux transporter [Corynebacterium halotolerans]|uniref:Transmembrane pair domain-containing protein n=1 Tax=Corynebacterium halotolerans YIM 70093 = DSM 44683 TaxID=1121362 RepID=M1P7E8_9CORY|nr:PACE efflux transporter [Corynebacterium halotolerans]AGF72561.1 transmembrane pair domain-containing protein [Corynebacterium halotolerans YIM 70093 = DSM 44683]
MSPILRRVIYVATYEIIAILFVTTALVVLGFGGGSSGLIAVVSSAVAIVWNFVWNTIFEAWERRQSSQKRTLGRRIVHSLGFEGGLVVFLVPILAWILQVSLVEAFLLEIGLLIFFLLYTFVFAWVFDLVLPPRHNVVHSSEPH